MEIKSGNPLIFSVMHWVYIHSPFSDIPTTVKLVAWNDGLMVGKNSPSPFTVISIAWKAIAIAYTQALLYTSKIFIMIYINFIARSLTQSYIE